MKFTKVLIKNSDFKRAYQRGKSAVHPLLVLYWLKNRETVSRYGITVSTKVGNAVERNRSRRLIREAYRFMEHRIKPGFDIVMVARTRTVSSNYRAVLSALDSLLKEEKLINEEAETKADSNQIQK